LFAAGGGTALGALEAAARRGVAVIGMDEDLYYQIEDADFVLGSIVKEAGAGVYALLQQAVSGQLAGGEAVGGYALGPLHSLENRVPPALRERLEIVRLGLLDGSIQTGVSREP